MDPSLPGANGPPHPRTTPGTIRRVPAAGHPQRGGHTQLAAWKQRELLPDGPPPPRPPTVREATDWLTRHPDGPTADDAVRRNALLAHCPELSSTARLVTTFAEILTLLDGLLLPQRIAEAKAAGLSGVSTFANGLSSGYGAVHAGLTTQVNAGHADVT
ncbi:hypothetical protein ACH4PU_16360 [Streptomyces sp. NPDC021100]|uniref:hypothetical protein n=1 Tax=Streptomyces sp. NPDC021100 TaxID=3365114 RepID=UPI0037A2543A